jgi:hypothetical protein
MAKRKVFGRRRVLYKDQTYILEMREDAIYVRKLYGRDECPITFTRIASFAQPQLELDLTFTDHENELDKNEQADAVSQMRPPGMVFGEPGSQTGDLHEAGEQPPQDVQGWPGGLPVPVGPAAAAPDPPGTTATDNQLPGANQ